jgi:hypothetical protein
MVTVALSGAVSVVAVGVAVGSAAGGGVEVAWGDGASVGVAAAGDGDAVGDAATAVVAAVVAATVAVEVGRAEDAAGEADAAAPAPVEGVAVAAGWPPLPPQATSRAPATADINQVRRGMLSSTGAGVSATSVSRRALTDTGGPTQDGRPFRAGRRKRMRA